MKPPIIISEQNDLEVYKTIENAILDLEAIDVINKAYVAYDSEGRLLRLYVNDPNLPLWGKEIRILIEEAENIPTHMAELEELLARHLEYINIPKDWISKATLEELVYKVLDCQAE